MSERSDRFNWNDAPADRKKWDTQLKQGEEAENYIAAALTNKKIEIKSESFIWQRTGNLAIEYRCRGEWSGIAATEAEFWAHELIYADSHGPDVPLGFIVKPTWHMKQLVKRAIAMGDFDRNAGDGGLQSIAKVRINDLWRFQR